MSEIVARANYLFCRYLERHLFDFDLRNISALFGKAAKCYVLSAYKHFLKDKYQHGITQKSRPEVLPLDLSFETLPDNSSNFSQLVFNKYFSQKVWQAVDKILTPVERQVIMGRYEFGDELLPVTEKGRYKDGVSFQIIEQCLGIPRNTAWRLEQKSIQKLRDYFKVKM